MEGTFQTQKAARAGVGRRDIPAFARAHCGGAEPGKGEASGSRGLSPEARVGRGDTESLDRRATGSDLCFKSLWLSRGTQTAE